MSAEAGACVCGGLLNPAGMAKMEAGLEKQACSHTENGFHSHTELSFHHRFSLWPGPAGTTCWTCLGWQPLVPGHRLPCFLSAL